MEPAPFSGSESFYRQLLDSIPIPVFVVNDAFQIVDSNTAAIPMLGMARSEILLKRSGEVLHCIHETDVPEGCGHGPHCKTCVIRTSLISALQGKRVSRSRTRVIRRMGGNETEIELLVTTAPIPGNDGHTLMILEDISEIMELRKLIPMCAGCRRIRNDQQYWQSVETYLRDHHSMDVSHGLCMECAEKLYPEFAHSLREKTNNGT